MAIIYETINLHNKEQGICPWRYLGSDQNNNPKYFGSSRDLRRDIEILGVAVFIKIVIEDCGDIENKELRTIEAKQYLKPNNVKTDPSYYNKTDHYGPGGSPLGVKHKRPRSEEHCKKIAEHRTGSVKSPAARQLMRNKKLGTKAKESTKKLMTEQRTGEKNHNALSWTVITPDGTALQITALRKWVRDSQLNFSEIYNSRNGWTAIRHGTGCNASKRDKEV